MSNNHLSIFLTKHVRFDSSGNEVAADWGYRLCAKFDSAFCDSYESKQEAAEAISPTNLPTDSWDAPPICPGRYPPLVAP